MKGLCLFAGLPFVASLPVLASGLPPVIDAGPPEVLALPAKDLTLFGHATDPESDPLTVTWTLTSGPAPVKFSAQWALATTVTFAAPGSYTFQLAVGDGTSNVTSSVTVAVNPASSQTAFYVDPTYTGSTQNGTASAPWKSLLNGDSDFIAKWNAITTALATNDVIVYFSARTAKADISEQFVPDTQNPRVRFFDFDDGPVLRNNLVFGNDGGQFGGNIPSIDSDYNLFAPTGSDLLKGSHSIVQSNISHLVVNAKRGNFHLTPASPAKDIGLNLFTLSNLPVGVTAFNTDIENVTRPQGPAWDIGAYELH